MMEERFGRFEERFERFVEYVEGRFQYMEDRFEHMEGRFRALPTREEWSQFATRADLKEEIGTLRLEMRERFEIVHDRLLALERGHEDLRSGVAQVRQQVNELGVRIEQLEVVTRDTNLRLIHLRDDMQQRFRDVNERLSSLEQRIAA